MSLFNYIDTNINTVTSEEAPLYKEVAWDLINNKPLLENGEFKYVTGIEAIKSWIYRTIQTERYRYEIYSWNHASELSELIGKPFNALNKAEAERIIKESILVNPYVTDLRISNVLFLEGKITIEFEVVTIYGNTKEVLSV